MGYERKIVETEENVFFFGREFSNFWSCEFQMKGIKFHSSEQAFMFCKAKLFGNEVIAEAILQAKSPAACKKLGRKVKRFDGKIWDEKCEKFMDIILFHKFSENPKLREMLLNTGNKVIVECAPFDNKWGIGISVDDAVNGKGWKGENKLGKSLMRVRGQL